jgi:hypothetical protein
MLLVGHPQPPAADDRSSAHGQTPLEWHTPLVPQPHRQWHHRSINRLVQAAKAKARGYRSLPNLIIYLIAGKLELASPT